MNSIKINNNNLERILYNNEPVIKFSDIDRVHERVVGTARRNFYKNKKHFIENEDYYFLTVDNAECTNIVHSNVPSRGQYLFTESGYLMLVKSFTDDLAWQVQRKLVNSYFRTKDEIFEQMEQEPYKIVKKTYKSIPIMTVRDIEHITGYDKSTINQYIRSKNLGTLLVGRSLSDIKYENKMFLGVTKSMNILYKKDVEEILYYLYKLDEYREFVDDYFKESNQSCSDITLLTRLMNLKFLRNATLNFSLSDEMRKDMDYIISKEYVRLGLLDKPTNDLNIDKEEGWNLLLKVSSWYDSVK